MTVEEVKTAFFNNTPIRYVKGQSSLNYAYITALVYQRCGDKTVLFVNLLGDNGKSTFLCRPQYISTGEDYEGRTEVIKEYEKMWRR